MPGPDAHGPPGAGPDVAAPVVPGRVLGARYELIRPIARGGMAEVWEGRDGTLRRAVAVKVLLTHLASDSSFVERFRREAVSAARVAHPCVVATFDAGVDAGTPFIVMELVQGQTLRQLLTASAPLDSDLAVAIAVQIADALANAHRAGLVHRDIKPGNILLCDSGDGSLRVKVTDFGIAKVGAELGSDLTQTGMVLGTPKYLSPEQVEGLTDPDARSDLYALGVVLFEMLTGRPPFVGPSDMATALSHLRETAPRVTTLRPGVSAGLDSLVSGLLSKSPGDRPPTAVAARQALELLARQGSRHGAANNLRSIGSTSSRRALRDRSDAQPPALNGPVGNAGWRNGAPVPGGRPPPTSRRSTHPGAESAGVKGGTTARRSGDSRSGGSRSGGSRTPGGGSPDGGSPNGSAPLPAPTSAPGPGGSSNGEVTHGPATHGPATHGPATHGPATHGPATHGPATHGPAGPGPVNGAGPNGTTVPPRPGELGAPTPTPPKPGGADAISPRRRPTGRRRASRIPGLLVAAVVLVAVIVAATLIADHGGAGRHGASSSGSAVGISNVTIWMNTTKHKEDDPSGTRYVFDGKPGTAWHTDLYQGSTGPVFDTFYSGEGLAIRLDSSRSLTSLTVSSPSRGWAASAYVSERLPAFGDPVSAWGAPTSSRSGIEGDVTLPLDAHRGQYVLLWLTNLGPTFPIPHGVAAQVSISEVAVR